MKTKNATLTLLLILVLLAIAFLRINNEPSKKEAFDRTPSSLIYTKHALCRMSCRQINKKEIAEVMKKGLIHFNKSDRRAKPCPTYALQARTSEGQYVRVIFAQCDEQTKVITCYDLEKEYPCDCPGD